ncbi:MAG: NAD(+)/NADH kinase [Bacillota bacterium]|nr:NAD(+)/NADH kinase [Bacillota bacterium]
MKTIGVIPNLDKDINYEFSKLVADKIIRLGGRVLMPKESAKHMECDVESLNEEEVYNNSEAVLSLGGDGTFLKVARNAYSANIPILGVNLGTLGFLTEIEKADIDCALENVINGKYTIEERMLLEAVIYSKSKLIARDIALNDVVISRGALSRILHLKTYINNVFADSYPGDGLIVSSPTGSTAYSFSAGGPIVEPDLDIIVVTPICPHILYSRSFITTGDRAVKVVVDEGYNHNAMVTVDGQNGYQVKGGYSIEVKKAPCSVKMIKIAQKNFFSILRSKIYMRGETFKDEI